MDQDAAEKYVSDTWIAVQDGIPQYARMCFKAGASHGRKAERARAEAILTEELHDLELAEFGDRDKERTNIRAWLMNARARIRAGGEKES